MFSARLKRRTKPVLLSTAIILGAVAGLGSYVDYSTSVAVFAGGFMPGMAATDVEALDAVLHPDETSPVLRN